jgi:hypothetical protein
VSGLQGCGPDGDADQEAKRIEVRAPASIGAAYASGPVAGDRLPFFNPCLRKDVLLRYRRSPERLVRTYPILPK